MIVEEDWLRAGWPVDDMWKKFDFTPPCSPYRDVCLDLDDLPDTVSGSSLLSVPTINVPSLESGMDDFSIDLDKCIDFGNYLDECENGEMPCRHGIRSGACSSCTQLAQAGSELRHDCMWVGTCTAEAHSHSHSHTDSDTHNSKRTHSESSTHISDLFLDSSALEGAAGFTHISDFEDDDDSQMDDLEDIPYPHRRPETPSESSATDTDEESHATVHEDHCYYRPRLPTPVPTLTLKQPQRHHHSRPSALHTPSDTEDEIDVVSVGSTDSDYFSSSSKGGTSKGGGGGGGGEIGKQTSPHHTATTTFVATSAGVKRVVRVRTSSINNVQVKPNKRSRNSSKQIQPVTVGVRRKNNGTNQSSVVFLRRTPMKNPKRLQQHQQQQQKGSLSHKRKSIRSDFDDPEKRHLHNSLERMRRVDQRKAFDELRDRVPELAEKDKVPKVEILKMAAKHIDSITRKERTLVEEKENLEHYHKELLKRLQSLRRQQR